MSWLAKLFRREASAEAEPQQLQCSHVNLMPTWDSPEDMGNADKASGLACSACGQKFVRAEAEATLIPLPKKH